MSVDYQSKQNIVTFRLKVAAILIVIMKYHIGLQTLFPQGIRVTNIKLVKLSQMGVITDCAHIVH